MKKSLYITTIGLLCLGLAGCGSTTYADTNGDDVFTLQTITDENIIHLEIGSSGLNYSEEGLSDVTLSSEYSAKDFNGVEQLYTTNFIVPSDVHIYIGHMNVDSGNFKLVAINNDEIIHEFALDTFNEEFTFENLEGSFSVHLAGESAAFSFNIDIY